MNGNAFFDTNVLIYSAVTTDPRSAVATALVAAGGVVSIQVLNEFTNTARRKLNRSWQEIRSALADFRKLCPYVRDVGMATHELALDLAERNGFAFYDALIVASALEAECSTLLTEDMQNGRIIAGTLTIRNPFAAA